MEEKKTAENYRHLIGGFDSSYPYKNGFIAQLLDSHSVSVTKKKLLELAVCLDVKLNENALTTSLHRFNKIVKKYKKMPNTYWVEIFALYQKDFNIPTFSVPETSSSTSLLVLEPLAVSATPSITVTPSAVFSTVSVLPDDGSSSSTSLLLPDPSDIVSSPSTPFTPSAVSTTCATPTSITLPHTSNLALTPSTRAATRSANCTQCHHKQHTINRLKHTTNTLKRQVAALKVRRQQEERRQDPKVLYRTRENLKRKSRVAVEWKLKFFEARGRMNGLRHEVARNASALTESEKERARLVSTCNALTSDYEKAVSEKKRAWNERDRVLTKFENLKKKFSGARNCQRKMKKEEAYLKGKAALYDELAARDDGSEKGGTAEDYSGHIGQVLRNVSHIYSLVDAPKDGCAVEAHVTMTELFCQKVKSAISDRAPVNHCVLDRLREELDLDLLDLKCAVHPLDGLARSAKSILATLDHDWQISSSNDSQAEIFIRNLAKLRFTSGTGDPVGFQSFLKEKKLNIGIILRYVGNRFNLIFHMAAIIFNLREDLLQYLRSRANKPLADTCCGVLQKPLIQVQLLCLGLYSKILTGPWMRELYGNSRGRSNLEVVRDGLYLTCLERLALLRDDPNLLFSCATDAFGHQLDSGDKLLMMSLMI